MPGPKKHRWAVINTVCPSCQHRQTEYLYVKFSVCRDCGSIKWQEDQGVHNGKRILRARYVQKKGQKVWDRAPPCRGSPTQDEDDTPREDIPSRLERILRDGD